MPDREKVIKEYEDYVNGYISLTTSYDYEFEMHKAVLALLKEQQEEIENLKQVAQSMMEGICLLKEQGWNLLTEDNDGVIHGLPGDDGQYLMTDGRDIWIDDYTDRVDDGISLDSGKDIREIKAWMYMPELP